MKNITYLLGAGASRNAIPILNELSEIMVDFARFYLNNYDNNLFNNPNIYSQDSKEYSIWEIGYFGEKGKKFGTIDTYAKKLVLNHSDGELKRLKLAVSNFFTIWQYSNNLYNKDVKKFKDVIDRRYISLLASILEDTNEINPSIKTNINFVSWNYDLQLEMAYKEFCESKRSWNEVFERLKKSNQILHLNGYHGHYDIIEKEKRNEQSLVNRLEIDDFDNIIEAIKFTSTSQQRDQIDFSNHINYAWEKNEFSLNNREKASKLFKNTDVLIVIGYSFPPFNKEIDRMLFKNIKKNTKIIYQDPKASKFIIQSLLDFLPEEIEIICEKNYLDSFILPDDFFN